MPYESDPYIDLAAQKEAQKAQKSAEGEAIADEAAKQLDESRFVITEDKFKTPSMGDYYIGEVDDTYLQLIDAQLRGTPAGDAKKAAFYMETPAVTTLGYYPDQGVYFFKAKTAFTQEDLDTGLVDGDTINVRISDIIDYGDDERVIDYLKQGISYAAEQRKSIAKIAADQSVPAATDDFLIRFVGIDAPEIPHWSIERNVDLSKFTTKEMKYSEVKGNEDYLCVLVKEGADRLDTDPVKLIRLGDSTWAEYKAYGGDLLVLSKDNSKAELLSQGFAAQKAVYDLINKAGNELYLMLDGNVLARNATQYPARFGGDIYKGDIVNTFKQFANSIMDPNQYRLAGFNLLAQELYGRFLGAIYLKIDGQWLNLNKYLIANYDKIIINKNFHDKPTLVSRDGGLSDAFGICSYQFNEKLYADAVWSADKSFDDRRKTQAKLFSNRSFDALKEWTVLIGDTALFVPPTSIRCITQTTAERMPVLRAKGTMAKSAEKSERILQLSLYFNDERGINGFELNSTTPNGKPVTYYMNGLRSLISQFKFTPFLPIDNDYINSVLNVEAVSLVDLRVSTVPGYPKLLQVTLTLQEFNYRVYMPEVPIQETDESEYRNYFAGCINFETMRYYYQRAIQKGQELAAKKVAFNSKEYIESTIGNKTALLPMQFKDPKVKFYIANETYLKQMLQTKIEAMGKTDATIVLTKAETQAGADLAIIYKKIQAMASDPAFTAPLAVLNTFATSTTVGIKSWLLFPRVSTAQGDITNTNMLPLRITDKSLYKYEPMDATELNKKVNDLMHRMRQYMNSTNAEAGKIIINNIGLKYVEEEVEDDKSTAQKAKVSIGIVIETQLDYLTNDEMLSNMRRDASLKIKESVDKFFKDRKLFIPVAMNLEAVASGELTYYVSSDSTRFYLDGRHPDMKFLGYCNDLTNAKSDPKSENIARKQAIDVDKLNSITFDPYDVDNARITSMEISFGNNFAKIGVTSMDGYAPQYMGGQDSTLSIQIQTTSKKTAAMLNALPKLSAYYAREYRLVLPCWPLKLESELTAFFGINEVLIESVTVDTSPGMPGLYQINMTMISVDRTLRNREALKRIEANTSKQGGDASTKINTLSYFELQDQLAQAEIYPDLELPTIQELKDDGFQFIRYKFQDNRVYPDPDFYFIYPHILTSQLLRESVLTSIENNFDDITWTDKAGGEMTTKAEAGTGVGVYKMNESAKSQRNAVRAMYEAKAKQLAENQFPDNAKAKNNNLFNVLNGSDTQESWNICQDIKCLFLERKYQLELDAYKNWKKAQDAIKDVDPKAVTGTKPTEGQWTYDSTSKAREASALIEKYLNGTQINEQLGPFYRGPDYDAKLDVTSTIKRYLVDDKICEIMYYLNIENTGTFQDIVSEIVYAAACSATAKKEFANKSIDNSWKPDSNFIGVRLGGAQDKGGKAITTNVDDAVDNAVEFSLFRIKQYTKEELIKITGESPKDMFIEYSNSVNTRRYLLDPYFRRAETTLEDIRDYKKGCIYNTKYAAVAFFRLTLYWLKQLIDTSAIPTITTDILRVAAKNELDTIEKINQHVTSNTKSTMEKHVNFFLKNSHALDSGKFFAAVTMALTSGDSKIKDRIRKRDYKGLNGYLQGVAMPDNSIDPSDGASLALRKMMLALVGLKRIKNFSAVGVSPVNPATEFIQDNNEKMYLKAAEDPRQYIQHSFHDMTVHDARGRMLRAFPAFYMLFIDEGRENEIWKLHDNFYNTSSIAEIQITKSRKIAADTARIVMSNMYKTFTSDDEDANANYNANWNDVVDSIFNPRVYKMREEAKRQNDAPVDQIRLHAGTRIHIRLGYGANAATLPVVFNGSIAEVQTGEAVELIAQGDGVELTNPILEDDEGHSIQYKDSLRGLFTNGATPKTILNAILTVKGGILKNLMKDTEYAHLLGRSPYGVYHFGNPDNNQIFRGGETIQNIYEAMSRPVWGEDDSVTASYATDEAPKISFEVYGKSIWDMLHICQSVSPDFIAAVAPFGFRSTIFHGHPRYYYAYDYIQKDGIILEKRKPYQQYHIYNSTTDIVKNNITTSDKDMKTCAIGLYEIAESLNIKNQKRVGPLWADAEIYPEYQRTMIVDTQLYGKGVPVVGFITNSITSRLTNWFADDSGDWGLISHDKVCWRMAASALKDSMKDMYQGDMIILGDSTVKPHDRMFINDSYENMTGQCLVKEVVHNFSAMTGYVTSVYPDAIITVDDRHELAVQSTGNFLFSLQSLVCGSAIWLASMAFGGPAASLGKGIDYIGSKATRGLIKGALAADKAGVTGAVSQMKSGIKAVKALLPAGRAIGAAGTIVAGASAAAICSALLVNAAVIGTTVLIGNYVTESISRWAKNLQVVQIFPLKRYGLPMTAGINGNKGLVYGSPSYGDTGLIKGMFAKLTTGKFNNKWVDPLLGVCQEWLLSDEMKNIGAKYRRDGGLINDKGNPVSDERMFTKTLKAVASSQGEITSSYRASQLTPRAALNDKSEVRKSYDYYAMLDVTRVQAEPKLQSNTLISSDPRLKPCIDSKFFQIVHEQENLNASKTVKPMTLMINGQSVNTKAIVGTSKDNSVVYDLPFLNQDALNILCEIVKRVKSRMPYADASDQHQAFEDTKGSFIMLKSALRVGDKDTFSSTGFSFILQGMKEAAKPLVSAIKELQTEIAQEAKTNQLLAPEMFRSEVRSNNEIAITVLLPSVSKKKEEATA